MKENLERTFEFIGDHEGQRVHRVKDDRGGLTSPYGMTLDTMKTLGLDLNHDGVINEKDVYLVTKEVALNAFREHFWNKINGDALPHGIDLILADVAWNSGLSKARQFIKEGFAKDIEALTARRKRFYKYQADKVPGQAKFYNGWINRANDAHDAAIGCARFKS